MPSCLSFLQNKKQLKSYLTEVLRLGVAVYTKQEAWYLSHVWGQGCDSWFLETFGTIVTQSIDCTLVAEGITAYPWTHLQTWGNFCFWEHACTSMMEGVEDRAKPEKWCVPELLFQYRQEEWRWEESQWWNWGKRKQPHGYCRERRKGRVGSFNGDGPWDCNSPIDGDAINAMGIFGEK